MKKLLIIETDPDTGLDRIVEINPDHVQMVIGINYMNPRLKPWWEQPTTEGGFASGKDVPYRGKKKDKDKEPTMQEAELIVARKL